MIFDRKNILESGLMPAIPQPFSQKPVSDWIRQFQQSETTEDRFQALQAIGLLTSPLEISSIASNALNDPDATIRALAAKLLRGSTVSNSSATEKRLVSLLDDPDPDVRFESARALARHKSNQPERVLHVFMSFLDEPETHALMIAAVLNAATELDLARSTAEELLLTRLLRLLDHERAEVREAVALTFARWPEISKTCTEQLLPLLDDSEPIVREKIAFTIGLAGNFNDEIRAALESATQDEDTEVAKVSFDALHRLGQK